MEFGWINLLGALIVVVMLIPNAVYAVHNKGRKNLCTNKTMNTLEQIGRYACIILMWLPLFVRKFGFASVEEMLLYLGGNSVLLTAYLIVFFFYMRAKRARLKMILALLPACIFLMSGLLLRHWLLVFFSLVFASGHIYVTEKNHLSP